MKFWRVFTCLLFVFLSKPCAYSTNDTLQLKQVADSFMQSKQYYQAAIYYQKLEFFATSISTKNQARLLAANAYKLDKNYTTGINHLNTINLSDANDTLVFNVKYQCALMSYLNNDLTQSEAFLEQLNYLIKDSSFIEQSLLLHVLVLNDAYKWELAKQKLKLLNTLKNKEQAVFMATNQLIDSLYALNQLPHLKSVDKASRLSTFFPGMGQCYSKNYGEGIMSFLSLTVVTGAMVVGVVYQYYFTSIFLGNMLLGKFYLGGVKRSEFLAERYNYAISKTYNQQLKTVLKEQFAK
jgi:hypothetical protein